MASGWKSTSVSRSAKKRGRSRSTRIFGATCGPTKRQWPAVPGTGASGVAPGVGVHSRIATPGPPTTVNSPSTRPAPTNCGSGSRTSAPAGVRPVGRWTTVVNSARAPRPGGSLTWTVWPSTAQPATSLPVISTMRASAARVKSSVSGKVPVAVETVRSVRAWTDSASTWKPVLLCSEGGSATSPPPEERQRSATSPESSGSATVIRVPSGIGSVRSGCLHSASVCAGKFTTSEVAPAIGSVRSAVCHASSGGDGRGEADRDLVRAAAAQEERGGFRLLRGGSAPGRRGLPLRLGFLLLRGLFVGLRLRLRRKRERAFAVDLHFRERERAEPQRHARPFAGEHFGHQLAFHGEDFAFHAADVVGRNERRFPRRLGRLRIARAGVLQQLLVLRAGEQDGARVVLEHRADLVRGHPPFLAIGLRRVVRGLGGGWGLGGEEGGGEEKEEERAEHA